MGRGDHKRDNNIGKSSEALGDAKSRALVEFHAFAGCDQTGKFNDHAKQSCWNTFIISPKKIIDDFMLLGNSIKHPTEECCIDGIIMFVLNLYSKNRPTDIDNQSYGDICFQKNSLNQISYHQHFQHSCKRYIEVTT